MRSNQSPVSTSRSQSAKSMRVAILMELIGLWLLIITGSCQAHWWSGWILQPSSPPERFNPDLFQIFDFWLAWILAAFFLALAMSLVQTRAVTYVVKMDVHNGYRLALVARHLQILITAFLAFCGSIGILSPWTDVWWKLALSLGLPVLYCAATVWPLSAAIKVMESEMRQPLAPQAAPSDQAPPAMPPNPVQPAMPSYRVSPPMLPQQFRG